MEGRQQPVHYPWDWVSPQLLNSKGEGICYPVQDEKDWTWARRLEWAIKSHRDLGESDYNNLEKNVRADRAAGTEKSAVQVSMCLGTCLPQSRLSHASIIGHCRALKTGC